jgi:hypothetical protein
MITGDQPRFDIDIDVVEADDMAGAALDVGLVDAVRQHRQDRRRVIAKNLVEIAHGNLDRLVCSGHDVTPV